LSVRGARGRPALHSFPTRRSSDLEPKHRERVAVRLECIGLGGAKVQRRRKQQSLRRHFAALERTHELLEENSLVRRMNSLRAVQDRKSTRLNSSHRTISYAVSCLK